jgi:LPS sulfotransferase NodH
MYTRLRARNSEDRAPVRVQQRPILVTGAHRSGTTWVGKMLALAAGTGYAHEPSSPLLHLRHTSFA